MEKQFAKLLGQVEKEFPGFTVEMGLMRHKGESPLWWIKLEREGEACECCGGERPALVIKRYCEPTFQSCLDSIREMVAQEANHEP